MSFPNQKKIIINKQNQDLFLMVGREDVLNAPKIIDQPCAIALYLYLACNKDGYDFDLSQAAYSNATGYSRSSYYRAITNLTEKGFIYEDNCGRLNFATVPKEGQRTQCQNWEDDSQSGDKDSQLGNKLSQNRDKSVSDVNREIKSIENNKKEKKEKNYPSSYEGLKELMSPLGEYDGKWLEDEVEGLWNFTNFAKVAQIVKNTDFTPNQAEIIAYHILDSEARSKYKRTDINGYIKRGA